MSKILRHIFPIIVSALLAACDATEPAPPAAGKADMELTVRINAAGATGTSRSFTEEYGSVEENTIDPADFKILLFDGDGVLYDVLYDCGGVVSVRGTETTLTELGPGAYALRIKLSGEHYDTSSKFAIVALANWQNHGANAALATDLRGLAIDKDAIGSLTIDDLKAATFTLNPNATDAWMPGNGNWIPMFGSLYGTLEAYDLDIFNAGNPMPLGDVNLLRAFSKIEVINRDLSDFAPKITGMDLMYRSTKGLLMPEYPYTGATAQVTAPTMPDNPGFVAQPIPFHVRDNIYTIYVPELPIGSQASLRQAIRITLDLNGQTEYKWIYLTPYDSKGNPIIQSTYEPEWNAILRNHIYRYTINSLAFELEVSVKKWIFGGKVHLQLESDDIDDDEDEFEDEDENL